jgi:regulator of protease activity HflC (stomatin/prohibitin superfamily)
MEKLYRGMPGFTAVLAGLLLFAAGLYLMITEVGNHTDPSAGVVIMMILLFLASAMVFRGLIIIQPNYAVTLTFFGKYVGTVKENGLIFVNPLCARLKVSLRSKSLESTKLKVNDKMGNPIEIAAVILWQVQDTYKAVFEVVNFNDYMTNQSEAAIRHLASSYPYDSIEDEHASITLRDGGDKVFELLEAELNERLSKAGIVITEARISHLAYAAEIAGAMLQRQQATAIVAARSKIVEGAVGMVEMALEMLSKKQIVEVDEDKKATMVSNLMVVLCGEKAATPVLNTGTLYQ